MVFAYIWHEVVPSFLEFSLIPHDDVITSVILLLHSALVSYVFNAHVVKFIPDERPFYARYY